ncbi:MAG: hypothetical protein NVSMB24_09760 [Mucilaginibacter sp.]
MKKVLSAFMLFAAITATRAQTVKAQSPSSIPTTQPYGKVEVADLEMTSCEFEKDANAEILFDKVIITPESGLTMERHTRFKIFNEFGKGYANVRIKYPSYNDQVVIADMQAETINLNNGKIEYIPVDKKSIYKERIDKVFSALVFAFPGVKPGSVIEYKYRVAFRYFPTWYFQGTLPTRYSEYKIDLTNDMEFRAIPHVSLPYIKNVGESTDLRQIKALANMHSLPDEPYMSGRNENLERIEYLNRNRLINTWNKIGGMLIRFRDFGDEFDRSVSGASGIVDKTRSLKTTEEKIALIFDTVKSSMKWNDITEYYINDGTVKAWDNKSGNSAEINLIVYQLLRKAAIKAYPMVVSTKKNGKINPVNPNLFQFNNMVVYVPVDSNKTFVLDATNKYNLYNTIPDDELNTFGLTVDQSNREYKTVFLENTEPAMQSVFLNAEVKAGGKMEGTAEITSYSYHKIDAAQKYKTEGQEKYIDYLRNKDNSVKISSIKMGDMEIDTLPLSQKINFSADLTGSDSQYIYFGTNLFTGIGANPFVNEDRYSDIDFGYRDNYSVSGIYKLPAGYKIDAMPKTVTILMPDQSIVFKRTIAEDNGTVMVRYVLNHKKTIYFKNEYQDIRGFYKKLYELLNEQIVLKKV